MSNWQFVLEVRASNGKDPTVSHLMVRCGETAALVADASLYEIAQQYCDTDYRIWHHRKPKLSSALHCPPLKSYVR